MIINNDIISDRILLFLIEGVISESIGSKLYPVKGLRIPLIINLPPIYYSFRKIRIRYVKSPEADRITKTSPHFLQARLRVKRVIANKNA